jgi:predicted O-methyltransferase YrrM
MVFTVDWFSENKSHLEKIINEMQPARLIEIGALEGLSTCWFIDQIARSRPLEVHAIDTWTGGVEHQEGAHSAMDMGQVEARFLQNTARATAHTAHPVDLRVHKCPSHYALAQLIADGREGQFDLIYVDGSHQAPDVLVDAVLAFKLLRKGGVLIFDDYLWQEALPEGTDPIRCPKTAIDAFVNIYIRKLRLLGAPARQFYAAKISD